MQLQTGHVDCAAVLATRELSLLENKSGKRKKYLLEAVLFHAGESLFRGHYVARLAIEGEEKWATRDDGRCGELPELAAKLHPFAPYLLFFKLA